MEEINQAIQVSMTREEERTQLIENILMSELKYAEWNKEVVTVEGERKIELEKMIANDETTIATWMENYDITFDDLDNSRTSIFTKAKAEKDVSFEEEREGIEETIASMTKELNNVPVKREKVMNAIDELIAGVNLYKP